MTYRLVILDRDDTLIHLLAGHRYVWGVDEFDLAPGAGEFVSALNAAGIVVVVVTNQQGVALPKFPEMTQAAVEKVHDRLQTDLRTYDARADRFYVCHHSADADCSCRKPRPGMFLQAMRDFGVSPAETAAIGDQLRDIEAVAAAGIRSRFLLRTLASGDLSPAPDAQTRIVASLTECQSALLG